LKRVRCATVEALVAARTDAIGLEKRTFVIDAWPAGAQRQRSQSEGWVPVTSQSALNRDYGARTAVMRIGGFGGPQSPHNIPSVHCMYDAAVI
jgi:hypothetical protein